MNNSLYYVYGYTGGIFIMLCSAIVRLLNLKKLQYTRTIHQPLSIYTYIPRRLKKNRNQKSSIEIENCFIFGIRISVFF